MKDLRAELKDRRRDGLAARRFKVGVKPNRGHDKKVHPFVAFLADGRGRILKDVAEHYFKPKSRSGKHRPKATIPEPMGDGEGDPRTAPLSGQARDAIHQIEQRLGAQGGSAIGGGNPPPATHASNGGNGTSVPAHSAEPPTKNDPGPRPMDGYVNAADRAAPNVNAMLDELDDAEARAREEADAALDDPSPGTSEGEPATLEHGGSNNEPSPA